jgi:hypothetical protein
MVAQGHLLVCSVPYLMTRYVQEHIFKGRLEILYRIYLGFLSPDCVDYSVERIVTVSVNF